MGLQSSTCNDSVLYIFVTKKSSKTSILIHLEPIKVNMIYTSNSNLQEVYVHQLPMHVTDPQKQRDIKKFRATFSSYMRCSSLKNLTVNNVSFQAVPASKAGQEICDQSLELSFPSYSFP